MVEQHSDQNAAPERSDGAKGGKRTNTQKQANSSQFDKNLPRASPASSPQVIENKNTIGMNKTREAQNQGKCPQNLAYHGIS